MSNSFVEKLSTNWQKEALDFLVGLYPIKKGKDIATIRTTGTELLKKHAHASSATLIRLEDSITARILYSTDPDLKGFVDAVKIAGIIAANKIVKEKGQYLLPVSNSDVYILPVTAAPFTGVFAVTYSDDFKEEEGFNDFLANIWVGLHDITMLVQTYYAIEQLGTRFNAILGTIPEAIVFVDETGKEGWLNGKAAELLNLLKENNSSVAIAQAMQRLRTSAVNSAEIAQQGAEFFMIPNQTIKDWMWLYGDPISQVLCVSCVPTVSANVSGRLWVFTDITPMYLATEQLKELNIELGEKRKIADDQNRAKSDFLANMSHEIRTPMNGVIGMTSLLANTNLDDEQKDFVDTIRISGDSLLSIINDILDFSKIESGKMELEEHPFKLSTVIEETFDMLGVKANEKGLDLLYFIDPNVPTEIIGDVTRFKQILVNLISNGVKFTDSGEVLFTASSLGVKDEIYTLEFIVRDTGIGIPEDKYHKLFDSFSQIDSSTTRRYGGTGLGLAICERLISLMAGKIRAESEVGKGSSFIFTIKVAANKKATHYNARERTKAQKLKGRSILILDDNKTNLKILDKQCSLWGMTAIAVDNYADALQLMREKQFDLAIIDMLMPDKDGLEVAGLMKQQNSELPLVLFSSAGYLPSKNEDIRSLFAAVLSKPVKHTQIEETLISVITRHSKENSATPQNAEEEFSVLPINILVAEDDLINQKLIIRTLEKIGYDCDVVDNGLSAVERVTEGNYQLVFMDVMMPKMDGYKATQAIVQNHKPGDRPIIIALTANALAGQKEKIMESGMDDYVSKPYKLQDLKNVFEKWDKELREKI